MLTPILRLQRSDTSGEHHGDAENLPLEPSGFHRSSSQPIRETELPLLVPKPARLSLSVVSRGQAD